MTIIQRISAITILFILIACSMLFLVQAPGNGNASGAGIPGTPEIRQPAVDSIFSLHGSMQIEWAPVADVDWYRIEWTDDPGKRGDNGNYSQLRGAEGRVDGTSHSLNLNDVDFDEGWWFFHVFGVRDQNDNGVPEDWTEWSADIRFAVDGSAPTIDLEYPQKNQVHQGNMITLAGTANDNFGLKEIVFILDGSAETISLQDKPTQTDWSSREINIGPGVHTLDVKALDWAGRESDTVDSRFNVDLDPPEVSITYPNPDQVFTEGGSPITMDGWARDDNQISELVYWLNSDGPFQMEILASDGDNVWNQVIDLQDGANAFTIRATDMTGAHDEKSITIYHDSDDPIVEISDYLIPEDWHGDWRVEKKDFGDGVPYYILDESSYEGDLVGYVEDSCGVQWLEWKMYNELGEEQKGSEAGAFTIIDDGLPTFNSKVDWKTHLRFEGDGIYEVAVQAWDRTNEKHADNRVRFIFDTQPPQIQSPQPEENQYVISDNPLSFNLQVNDNVGILLVQYKFDDGDWMEYYNHDPGQGAPPKDHGQQMDVDIPEGEHNMELMIIDIGGRQTSTSYNVILDKEEPAVQINEPGDGDVIEGGSVHIGVHASDNANLAHIEIFADNRGNQDGGNPDASGDINGDLVHEEDIQGNDMDWGTDININSGKNFIYVRVTDVVGRQSINFITIYSDHQMPGVTIIGPSDNDFIDSLNINIQGNADDDTGLIEQVEIRFLRPWEEGSTDPEQDWNGVNGNKDWNFDWNAPDGGEWIIQTRSIDKIGQKSAILTIRVKLPGETPDQEDLQNMGEEGSDSDGLILGFVIGLVIIVVLIVIYVSTSKGVAKSEKELKKLEEVLAEKRSNKE